MDYKNNKKIDKNPIETQEWIDSLKSIIKIDGEKRANFLLNQLTSYANQNDISLN